MTSKFASLRTNLFAWICNIHCAVRPEPGLSVPFSLIIYRKLWFDQESSLTDYFWDFSCITLLVGLSNNSWTIQYGTGTLLSADCRRPAGKQKMIGRWHDRGNFIQKTMVLRGLYILAGIALLGLTAVSLIIFARSPSHAPDFLAEIQESKVNTHLRWFFERLKDAAEIKDAANGDLISFWLQTPEALYEALHPGYVRCVEFVDLIYFTQSLEQRCGDIRHKQCTESWYCI